MIKIRASKIQKASEKAQIYYRLAAQYNAAIEKLVLKKKLDQDEILNLRTLREARDSAREVANRFFFRAHTISDEMLVIR